MITTRPTADSTPRLTWALTWAPARALSWTLAAVAAGSCLLALLGEARSQSQTPARSRQAQSGPSASEPTVSQPTASGSPVSGRAEPQPPGSAPAAAGMATRGGKRVGKVAAEAGRGGQPAGGSAVRRGRLPGITPAREAAVMTFVGRHHPELAELLIHLKEHDPAGYKRAISDLMKTSERLAQTHERDPDRYDIELRIWQSESRAQLLSAKYQMRRDDHLLEQLRAAIEAQQDGKLALLERERQRLLERLERLEGQLSRARENREQQVDRQLRAMTRLPRKSKTAP